MLAELTSEAYRRLRPLLFGLDAETAHHLAMDTLAAASRLRFPLRWLRAASGQSALAGRSADGTLSRTVFGLRFPNPVGLAAGFDKNGVALTAWEALGFGFVEAGTITARAQPGNPPPRLFRVPERAALINRLGFNNGGAEAAAARFRHLRATGRWPAIPVGINLGKSRATPLEKATEDYVFSLGKLHPFGDYFVLNVSSPNTPGLRSLQGRDELDALLRAVQAKNRALPAPRPLLVKIAPDLNDSQLEEILDLAGQHALAGIVATNTTVDHSALPASAPRETGGLSGPPLRARATEIVRFLTARTSLPVIAVGGISDAASVREKLDAGAALVQLYTGFVYGGPTLIPDICRGLLGERGRQ